jgi:hypothetical protein
MLPQFCGPQQLEGAPADARHSQEIRLPDLHQDFLAHVAPQQTQGKCLSEDFNAALQSAILQNNVRD